jgi:hypothetical protein
VKESLRARWAYGQTEGVRRGGAGSDRRSLLRDRDGWAGRCPLGQGQEPPQGEAPRPRDEDRGQQADKRQIVFEAPGVILFRIARILPQFVRAVVQDVRALTPEEQEQLGVLLRRLGRQECVESAGEPER